MAPWDRSSSEGDGVATEGGGVGGGRAGQTSNTGDREKKIKCNKHKQMACEG